MAEADGQRLPAAEREAGNRPVVAVAVNAQCGIDHRNHVLDQIPLEALPLLLVLGGVSPARPFRPRERIAEGHHHDQRLKPAVGDQVVQDHVRLPALGP